MYSNLFKNSLLGLMFSVVVSNSASADHRHYPIARQALIEVGTEEFDENYTSLAGLEGVHVVSKYVLDSAKKYNLSDFNTDLVKQIEDRFKRAGLRLLSEREVQKTPGQPTLTFFPAYTGNDIQAAKSKSTSESVPGKANQSDAEHDCCRSSIWASFQQSSSILRSPNKHYKFATWGLGEDTDECENRGEWTYEAVLKVVDKFIADYTKAQSEIVVKTEPLPKLSPKLVSHVGDVPQECAQAWLMNLGVFETNQTDINNSVKPILNELAMMAFRCEGYSYIIETHADQRADSNYNRILSEARGYAIKDYLVSLKVSHNRLKTVAYGESKPLSSGSTEQDHAVNRRVVIIPQLGNI